ncbi:MAG: ATP-binding cassette domain-containing protein [Pseudomonadota bacterium]
MPFADVRCDAASWTALLGASGIGKSTVLRLLAGLPVHWRFEGELAADDGEPLAHRVALMAQQDLLLPWHGVVENVSLGARLRGEAVDRDRVLGLIDRVGLQAHAGKRPPQLSGGQRQRVALARTLMEDKPVVLLDEPFSALDARTRSEMQDLAAEVLVGRTVVMVTHDPAEAARLGHRVLLMTPVAVEDIVMPSAPPPRPVDDDATLRLQGQLLRRLREPEAAV